MKLFSLLSCGLLLASPALAGGVRPSSEPVWKHRKLGQVDFKNRVSTKAGAPMRLSRSNPDGAIWADDLISAVQVAAPEAVELIGMARDYENYVQGKVNEALANLVLDRILDNEIFRQGISLEPSEGRVRQALLSILSQYAGPSPADTPLAVRYEALKKIYGGSSALFSVSWKGDPSLERREGKWPAMTLTIPALPDTWKGLETQIRDQLQAPHRMISRASAWKAMVDAREKREPILTATAGEWQQAYEELKEEKFKIENATAHVWDVEATGPMAAAFGAAVIEALNAAEVEIQLKEMDSGSDGLTQERVAALRKLELPKVLEKVLSEKRFAEAVRQHTLKTWLRERIFQKGSGPEDVFDPMLASSSLFPKILLAGDTIQTIRVIQSVVREPVRYLSPDDSRAQFLTSDRIRARVRQRRSRELAFALFRANPYEAEIRTCADLTWPCEDAAPRVMSELLFP